MLGLSDTLVNAIVAEVLRKRYGCNSIEVLNADNPKRATGRGRVRSLQTALSLFLNHLHPAEFLLGSRSVLWSQWSEFAKARYRNCVTTQPLNVVGTTAPGVYKSWEIVSLYPIC